MSGHPFKIYNASAGSGKTHTLTKEYLKIALSSSHVFGQILAITFTNKAVNEMKQRILKSLYEFSSTSRPEEASTLFNDLMTELNFDQKTLQKKAKKTLKDILHNYGFFDISTIDKFTHRLIRTFAKDLKLAQNFEVVLDTDLLLGEAVDQLIEKIGLDTKLTKVLLEFALDKINDDKSWDISFDLNKIGKLLFNETHSDHLKKMKGRKIEDFLEFQKRTREQIAQKKEYLVQNASKALKLIEDNGLATEDFKSGYFPKFMMKIESGTLQFDFGAAWKKNFENTPLYIKSCPDHTKFLLDGLHEQFIDIFNNIKHQFTQTLFLVNIYKNLVPLTVLNAIHNEVKAIQADKGQLPISEFNTIISNEIKNQPAPFIYERLGEKYRHYFIDEFQDTSELQWNNLVPLIGNALESEDLLGQSGSLFLVGDVKQAIYRWRGGKAEQFLNLVNSRKVPFMIFPEVKDLPSNYRSHEEIIKFNNDFFTTTSSILGSPLYSNLFEKGNRQKYNAKKGGHVQLTFIDEGVDEDLDTVYCQYTLETIDTILNKGYAYSDIAILVRDNKHGVILADFLSLNKIPTISPDSLLVSTSKKVQFLINLLHFSIHQNDLDCCYNLLYFLSAQQSDKHSFIWNHLKNVAEFLNEDYRFDVHILKQKSVYDGLEYAIKQFDLADQSDAHLTFLMDIVLEVEQKEGSDIFTFLSYWEKKKDKHSISAPNSLNAVQIMSIHKSKGLEFPIVIFPYANSHIYKEIDPKIWLPVNSNEFNGFEEVLISKKNEALEYNDIAAQAFEEEHHKLELDAFNILYVVLTRAVKGLYIVSQKSKTSKEKNKPSHYSDVFVHYLKEKKLWDETKTTYTFGQLLMNSTTKNLSSNEKSINYQYSNKENPSFRTIARAGALWDTQKEVALTRGNLVHYIMGLIETGDDVEKVFDKLHQNGTIGENEAQSLKEKVYEVIYNPKLKPYYSKHVHVKNEKDIITANAEILRPDRIVIQGNKATIIDYKTGKENINYKQQLEKYALALENMGFTIENKIIAYINDKVVVENL